MIIKGKKRKVSFWNWVIPLFLIALLMVLLSIKLKVFETTSNNPKLLNIDNSNKLSVYCGAENIVGDKFVSDGIKFSGVNTRSKEKAHTGDYSSKLDKNNRYGMTYIIPNPSPGTTYKIEAWSYSSKDAKRFIAVSGERKEGGLYYKDESRNVETDGDWWVKHEMYFTLPTKEPVSNLKVFVYKDNSIKIVYFDDFRIMEVDQIPDMRVNSDLNLSKLSLQLDKEGADILSKVKKNAISTGLLSESTVVDARISSDGEYLKAKIRYKGDWLDHLMGSTPSYRIKLKKKDSWNGLQTFSIQHPKTRSYLREWVFHEMLFKAGVLAPRFDLVHFKFNDKEPMIMVYEEHFTKNLVENQLRREGPILKLTEDRFWEGMKRSIKSRRKLADASNKETAFWTSEIKPFKEKRTRKDKKLSNNFEIAQNLLYQYKYGLKKPGEVFDIDKLAKYLVVTDICMAYHTRTWHNQRFYYNPVSSLLEPIGYDGYGGEDIGKINQNITSEDVYHYIPYSTEPIYRLFYDKEFMEKYIQYLDEYSQADFIRRFVSQIKDPIEQREKWIKTINFNYHYNLDELFERANIIHDKILPFENSLQIFPKSMDDNNMILQLYNAHGLPIEIVNIGKKKAFSEKKFGEGTVIFPQEIDKAPKYVEIVVPKWATNVFYKLPGLDTTYVKSIPKWSSPKNWSPRQELAELVSVGNNIYTENDNIIVFDKKKYDIESPIIIPKGKKVIVKPGVEMNFNKGGFILSYSPVSMLGDSDEPIIIKSKDGKSGSFTIMQAAEKSVIRHVEFHHQNTLNYKGWNLSGGVTVYESSVDFRACKFIGNQCEDALNIVYSDFKLDRCTFSNVYSDAFDADFCKGEVNNCIFRNIGNDGLDFSTSTIKISGCDIDKIGDKGISVGEQAVISVNYTTVKNANIAFASKDKSVLSLDNITISNCKKGITAYQKKPEYGPATIKLGKYKIDKTEHHFLIEEGSILNK